jgi:hypothetical protein
MVEPDRAARREEPDLHFCGFHNLMPNRVRNVLLVSSLYESFILEEEGLLTELITSEYVDMNLSQAPRVSRASTGKEALEFIKSQPVDLVITMTRLGQWNLPDFARAVKAIRPNLPVLVLAGENRELLRHPELSECESINRIFVWNGDAKILLAIVKFVEDQLNAEHDTRYGDVRVIILVENSVRFYSAYLPLIYGELVKLTQTLMAEGINPMHRLLRMRARPKILLAETFEEASELYAKYSESLLGVISDIRFPKNGELNEDAGLEFIRLIRADSPHLPVLLQSSEPGHAQAAAELQAFFLNKNSPRLLQDLRTFILGYLGFGDFVFVMPDGSEVARAHDLLSFERAIATVPSESLVFHARSNHFSNWLMARTEFALAARIRPRKVTDFASVAELRKYMVETLAEFRERTQSGVITDFSPARLGVPMAFTRIGSGSIGGKARGLAFINALIRRYDLRHRFEGVRIAVPSSAAIGTDVYDEFLEENHLREFVARDVADDQTARAFLAAKLPKAIFSDLTTFLRQVRYPLAVRSSSLLEDSQGRPFAGVYTTHMIPNNHTDLNVRLDQLCDAIKLVYASTFFRSARRYLRATGRHSEEEKMGVILQELVGSAHHGRFYPTFSGVARSYNYYPTEQMTPEDGIASVALGLGKMVVEGGQSLMFSPALPHVLPQFPTTKDLLANSQRQFIALDVSHPEVYPTPDANANLVRPDLDVAEADGTLAPIGSVYSPENDVVYDGVLRDGPRLVTFAHVLKSELFPLAAILRLLLEIGREGMACPIEIEFAVDMSARPMEFGFLQIRPIYSFEESGEIDIKDADPDHAICFSPRALGDGHIAGIHDIVYVKPDEFDKSRTQEIAAELAKTNDDLRESGRQCVLIGPGRWGSADRWLGIPVTWEQISSAQVIVEASLEDFVVTPSQGTHFFQNLTSFGIGYLTVHPSLSEGFIDWAWLAAQPVVEETRFVRRVRVPQPLDVVLNGRTREGVIFKPGVWAAARNGED